MIASCRYDVLQIQRTQGVIWSGCYADDGIIHAPLPALELALTSLVASLQSCKVEVNLTKSRIVVPNASQLVHFPHLRSLHVTPIDYGFELSFWADLSQAPC